MARPYSLTNITDIPLSTTVTSLIANEPGQKVDEDSQVRVYATRETVDISIGITIGRDVGLPNGSPCNLNAVVGTLPSRQDDLLWSGFAAANEEIIIQGINGDGAAARELRVLVDVRAIDDGPFESR